MCHGSLVKKLNVRDFGLDPCISYKVLYLDLKLWFVINPKAMKLKISHSEGHTARCELCVHCVTY